MISFFPHLVSFGKPKSYFQRLLFIQWKKNRNRDAFKTIAVDVKQFIRSYGIRLLQNELIVSFQREIFECPFLVECDFALAQNAPCRCYHLELHANRPKLISIEDF